MKNILLIGLFFLKVSYMQAQTLNTNLPLKLDLFLKKSSHVKEINLTTENTFKPRDLVISMPEKTPTLPEKKILISPKIVKLPKINLIPLNKVINVIDKNFPLTAPIVQPLMKINDPSIQKADASPINLDEISETEYKMIQALIFFEIQKKYDIALSLFNGLLHTTPYGYQALLHYAESAHELGLYSEYRNAVLKILNEVQDKPIKSKTIQNIVQNVEALDIADMKLIDSLVMEFNVNINKNDTYLYRYAKYLISNENLSTAENTLSQISNKSDFYNDAALLSASLNYRQGEVTKAITKLEKSILALEGDKKNILRNSSIATLARLYFQNGQYKKSYETYLKIDKSSPLWLQSVIEQAWAQIRVGDHIGAAGNMFSLHTEIFKKAYVPESYIVRSIGYLNLCQYGDALHVLTDLDNRFKQIHEKLVKFQSNNSNPMIYFDLIKNWFKSSEQSEINTLPRSFIAELAVHPSFTSIQKQINKQEEELSTLEKFVSDFSNKENLIKQRINNTKNEIKALKNQGASPDILFKNEMKIKAAEIEIQVVNNGQTGLNKIRQTIINRLENKKDTLRNIAATGIKNRYNDLVESLGKFLEQEEVLAYEIYSGAGEHIRYQMADGKINDRDPASLTPEEKKSYKWKFRGEVWEDEIGHYRSSLKNVCGKEELAQTKGEQ